MSNREDKDRKYLGDMLEYTRRGHQKVANVSRDEFDANDTLQFAVMYLILVVGEAAYRLSADARAALPQLPWKDMINMRHRLVHGYGIVSRHIVWQVAKEDLPVLIAHLESAFP